MQIVPLTPVNAVQAGEALAAAFEGYPMMNFFLGPDHGQRVRDFFGMIARIWATSGGPHLVAGDGGRVLGATLLQWPDPEPWSKAEEDEWDAFVATLPEGAASRFEAYGELKKRLVPETPHLYLGAIGVKPELQGKGVGTALLRAVAQAAAPLPVWLDTQKEDNVRIYESQGYAVRAEANLQGIPFWVMERPTA